MKKSRDTKNSFNSFQIVSDSKSENIYIKSSKTGLYIKIKKNGFIPKLGLILLDYIYESEFSGANAVEIGTGETGVIAQNLYLLNRFNSIWGVDLDESAINHACNSSEISQNIIWVRNHCFNSLEKLKFDLIISNPPQMPVKENLSLHDDGGKDGLDIIRTIISEGCNYLTDNGIILLICFDFLVDSGEISKIAEHSGLQLKVKKSYLREVRTDGKTIRNLNWIHKKYPNFKLKYTKSGIPFHFVRIIELTKIKHEI